MLHKLPSDFEKRLCALPQEMLVTGGPASTFRSERLKVKASAAVADANLTIGVFIIRLALEQSHGRGPDATHRLNDFGDAIAASHPRDRQLDDRKGWGKV